uniref:Uncharacterized protein n=1 Tax=Parascaris univalens TaxID=6257 RepID=A0A915ANJ3_PARUN
MACNPCCCWNVKDGAVTIGIWTMIFSVIELAIFSWQIYDIKYQRNLASNYLIPAFNTYGSYGNGPTYYENYYDSPLTRFYTGLFVIQILCLISSFFLLFAAVALMYGAHTYSRYLIWPWFPCMIASILTSLAYCIMWWTGDVRSYWLILTILELIGVLINLYCLTAVLIFYRQLVADRNYYERKQRVDRYDQYPEMYDKYRKDNYYSTNEQANDLDYSVPPAYHRGGQTPPVAREEYRRLSDYNQEPPPAIRPKSPYRDQVNYPEDDMVSNWVKDQQTIGLIPDHANSEPTTPVREPFGEPIQHSFSVPSMYAETSGATSCHHHHCHKRHHRHRSSSRHRHDDSSHNYRRVSSRRHSKHRHRSSSAGSRSRRSYSSDSYSTEFTEEPRHHRRRSRSCERYSDESTPISDDSREQRRQRRREDRGRERDRERPRGPRQVKRVDKEREAKSVTAPIFATERLTPTLNGQWPAAGTEGGITIPQHIIIPPSSGTIGPDGRIQPQTYQINSEIRISYDQYGRPLPSQAVTPSTPPQPQIQTSPSAYVPSAYQRREQPVTSIV